MVFICGTVPAACRSLIPSNYPSIAAARLVDLSEKNNEPREELWHREKTSSEFIVGRVFALVSWIGEQLSSILNSPEVEEDECFLENVKQRWLLSFEFRRVYLYRPAEDVSEALSSTTAPKNKTRTW